MKWINRKSIITRCVKDMTIRRIKAINHCVNGTYKITDLSGRHEVYDDGENDIVDYIYDYYDYTIRIYSPSNRKIDIEAAKGNDLAWTISIVYGPNGYWKSKHKTYMTLEKRSPLMKYYRYISKNIPITDNVISVVIIGYVEQIDVMGRVYTLPITSLYVFLRYALIMHSSGVFVGSKPFSVAARPLFIPVLISWNNIACNAPAS